MFDNDRRAFTSLLAPLGVAMLSCGAAGGTAAGVAPGVLRLARNDWVPNHPDLPVLHYRQAVPPGEREATAQALEAMFERSGWPPQWRDGVYDYHHYHSTAHEVLGIAGGHARLMLGGPGCAEVAVTAGDVVVLPVGTGHCQLSASEDFLVVGAYPPGQEFDLCRSAPTPAMEARMRAVPMPETDPVSGVGGPLVALWRGDAA